MPPIEGYIEDVVGAIRTIVESILDASHARASEMLGDLETSANTADGAESHVDSFTEEPMTDGELAAVSAEPVSQITEQGDFIGSDDEYHGYLTEKARLLKEQLGDNEYIRMAEQALADYKSPSGTDQDLYVAWQQLDAAADSLRT